MKKKYLLLVLALLVILLVAVPVGATTQNIPINTTDPAVWQFGNITSTTYAGIGTISVLYTNQQNYGTGNVSVALICHNDWMVWEGDASQTQGERDFFDIWDSGIPSLDGCYVEMIGTPRQVNGS